MTGRVVVIVILVAAVLAGAGLYYTQVYAYYARVPLPEGGVTLTPVSGGPPEPIPATGFEAIDATSSPLRYRDCFDTDLSLATLTETFVIAEDAAPRVGPGWFACFDADDIGRALETGEAVAFLGAPNVSYGVDRVTAVFRDGRARSWHQINACGQRVFDGDPPPDGCPPPPADQGPE